MTKYTQEEIEIAIRLDDDAHPIAETLRWAAGQYLKSLTIIEFYAGSRIDYALDDGQLARSFLNDSL